MIKSFRCKETQRFFDTEKSRRFSSIGTTALRKLIAVDAARQLGDLKSPGNQLEALKGDRAGQHSIRINEQYRICFVWSEGNAYEVEIVDYH